MKKIIALSSIIALTLTGCASTQLDDTRVKTVEGEVKAVKVVNIPSFDIEIAPRKATCQLTDTAGNAVASECLQYRRTHERNYNVLSGNIEGFSFEEGNRYVLNISQTAVDDEASGKVVPVWKLNKVISVNPEIINPVQ
ncbi:DUF4377 domain-containing protein [Moraxella bovis]|uniref:DUF4377 domain-containing protein n=2 Tax=Moraxella TaxID=475 RepID=A0AAQ2T0X2_MORBO|nr:MULTISPECIES: DUF4377 domain-containing protein [Moraxella]AWY20309.1 hypothetical protein DQF64_07265 [Moraxella bovis]UYZ74554.1 DUF4377 domain-containing protein [Moraxella bovis]UYZ79521.1 DUF4377 domain-containing protein [Moraxella bovis]UYZ88002.1 DUF4377 domain-containing protein [Moraxella bovis]UYZ90729.1 DUF4377 domain-containing protein [Moraxella bovis]